MRWRQAASTEKDWASCSWAVVTIACLVPGARGHEEAGGGLEGEKGKGRSAVDGARWASPAGFSTFLGPETIIKDWQDGRLGSHNRRARPVGGLRWLAVGALGVDLACGRSCAESQSLVGFADSLDSPKGLVMGTPPP